RVVRRIQGPRLRTRRGGRRGAAGRRRRRVSAAGPARAMGRHRPVGWRPGRQAAPGAIGAGGPARRVVRRIGLTPPGKKGGGKKGDIADIPNICYVPLFTGVDIPNICYVPLFTPFPFGLFGVAERREGRWSCRTTSRGFAAQVDEQPGPPAGR